jgi:hypothetical protein
MKSPSTSASPSPPEIKKKKGASIWKFLFHPQVGRVFLFLCVGGSLGLLWWSVNRLQPLRKEAQDLSQTITRLTGDLEKMGSEWSADTARDLLRSYEDQGSNLLFNAQSLTNWMADLKLRTIPLVLDTSMHFGQPTSTNPKQPDAPVILPITFQVTPNLEVESIYSPYQRVLRFLYELTNSERRADLVEVQIRGQTNSIQHVAATVNLWFNRIPE